MEDFDKVEYTFDTNVFIYLFRHIPKDIFVSIWALIEEKFIEQKIVIIKDVFDELSKVDDDEVFNYVKNKKDNIIELSEEVQTNLRTIVNTFPNWINPNSERNAADPSLVASGMTYNIKIITQEKIRGNKLKIPFICNKFGVACGDFFDFLRDHNVRV